MAESLVEENTSLSTILGQAISLTSGDARRCIPRIRELRRRAKSVGLFTTFNKAIDLVVCDLWCCIEATAWSILRSCGWTRFERTLVGFSWVRCIRNGESADEQPWGGSRTDPRAHSERRQPLALLHSEFGSG